jgi:hypothetical protein
MYELTDLHDCERETAKQGAAADGMPLRGPLRLSSAVRRQERASKLEGP